MAKFTFQEVINSDRAEVFTAKMNSAVTNADVGKPVKLSGDSTYDLCADGDAVEGFLFSVEPYGQDGKQIVSIGQPQFKKVTATGAIGIGQYVIAAASGKVKQSASSGATVTRWRYVSGGVTGTGDRVGVIQRCV